MRRFVLVALCLSATARADDDAPATEEIDPTPLPKSVHVRLEGTVARLVAKFEVRIKGPSHDENDVTLDVPASAVATRATVTIEGKSHALDLVPAEQAKKRYDALASENPVDDVKPNRWGVLLSGGAGRIEVAIAAPRTATVGIELELQAPTCYFRDARYVAIPKEWKPVLDASARVPAQSAPVTAACAGASVADEDMTWIGFPSRELAQRKAGADRVGATAGAIAVGDTRVARFEVDIASVLGDVPRDLATAIVVDASRSLTPAQIDAQRELVLSYLDKAPSSRVQVIAFARRARALLPAWTSATQATVRVDRELRALAPRNGSNFDAGLSEAASWLARATGTRRVVLLTDDRMAKRLYAMPAAQLRALLPRDTLVHVVALGESEAPERDDTWTLAPLAALTRGHSIRSGLPEEGVDATLLVRPIQLDNVTIKAPGWTELNGADITRPCSESLGEGHSCVWWGSSTAIGSPIASPLGSRSAPSPGTPSLPPGTRLASLQAAPIAVEAKMWGETVTRVLAPDFARGRDVARELVTFDAVDSAIVDGAAHASRAVTKSWSLYAEWGGRNGYDVNGIVGRCGCGGSSSSGSSFGHGGMIGHRSAPPLDLLGQLAGPVARCNVGRQVVEADVETTRSEIVDVTVAIRAVDPVTAEQLAALRTCVEDAIWDTAITVPPHVSAATTRVAFAPSTAPQAP